MTFWRRLRYYLIGLGLGLILVFFIFGNRSCDWLPENRVLDEINESRMMISERAICQIECNQISDKDVYALFSKRKGEVLFSESNTDTDPRVYIIEGLKEETKFKVAVEIADSIATITGIERKDLSGCECVDKADDELSPFWMPSELVVEMLQEKPIKYTSHAGCQLECIDMSKEQFYKILKEGNVNHEKSDPLAKPNPYFTFRGDHNGKSYELRFDYGEQATRLREIEGAECDCEE